MFGVGGRQLCERAGIAEIFEFLGEGVANAQRICRPIRCGQRGLQPGNVVGFGGLAGKNGERVVDPGIAGSFARIAS